MTAALCRFEGCGQESDAVIHWPRRGYCDTVLCHAFVAASPAAVQPVLHTPESYYDKEKGCQYFFTGTNDYCWLVKERHDMGHSHEFLAPAAEKMPDAFVETWNEWWGSTLDPKTGKKYLSNEYRETKEGHFFRAGYAAGLLRAANIAENTTEEKWPWIHLAIRAEAEKGKKPVPESTGAQELCEIGCTKHSHINGVPVKAQEAITLHSHCDRSKKWTPCLDWPDCKWELHVAAATITRRKS